jgi:hypothetical protein
MQLLPYKFRSFHSGDKFCDFCGCDTLQFCRWIVMVSEDHVTSVLTLKMR